MTLEAKNMFTFLQLKMLKIFLNGLKNLNSIKKNVWKCSMVKKMLPFKVYNNKIIVHFLQLKLFLMDFFQKFTFYDYDKKTLHFRRSQSEDGNAILYFWKFESATYFGFVGCPYLIILLFKLDL